MRREISAIISPRVATWLPRPTNSAVAPGRRRTTRMPSVTSPRGPPAARLSARASRARCSAAASASSSADDPRPTIDNVARPNRTVPATAAASGPDTATRIPARSGPAKAPSPSPVDKATLAATSSPGVRASDGKAADWEGRTRAPAVAPTAFARNSAGNEPPATMTPTAATAAIARIS